MEAIEKAKPYNPWREFIENCISGDNYFRASEYRELLEYIDDLLEDRAALSESKPAVAPKMTDGDINDITLAKLGKWPSFEAQSWACKVAHAVLESRASAAPQEQDEPSALEQAMIDKRIAVIPEYDGGWHAEIYCEEGAPIFSGRGATPYEAVNDAISANPRAVLAECEPIGGTHPAQAPQQEAGQARELERMTHERDTLAKAIRDAAVKAEICRPDADLTGPHLLMLCDDMARCINEQARAAQSAPAVPNEREALTDELILRLAGGRLSFASQSGLIHYARTIIAEYKARLASAPAQPTVPEGLEIAGYLAAEPATGHAGSYWGIEFYKQPPPKGSINVTTLYKVAAAPVAKKGGE